MKYVPCFLISARNTSRIREYETMETGNDYSKSRVLSPD